MDNAEREGTNLRGEGGAPVTSEDVQQGEGQTWLMIRDGGKEGVAGGGGGGRGGEEEEEGRGRLGEGGGGEAL